MDILEGLRKDVPTYSDLCSEFQDILLVDTYNKGLSIDVQNPINPAFGVIHSVSLIGRPPSNPMAPPPPSSGPHRTYSFGAYYVPAKNTKVHALFNTASGLSTMTVDHKHDKDLKFRLNSYVSCVVVVQHAVCCMCWFI